MPTPSATLNWSGRGEQEVVNGVKIERSVFQVWTVVDAETSAIAKTATDLPGINTELTPGSPYRARGRTIQAQKGPTTWEVRVDFSIPENGGTFPTDEIDPLLRPPVLTWGTVATQRSMERDRGNPAVRIRNSAGDIFDPPVTEDYEFDTLTVTKWFPFYDRSLRRQFVGGVNEANYTLGNTTFLPGEILCKSILPVGSSELAPASESPTPASLTQVAFVFWLDSDSRADPDESGHPFDAHLVDQGLYGWYTDPVDTKVKRGRICQARAAGGKFYVETLIDNPVLLNGSGRPMNTDLKIASKPFLDAPAYAPVDTPNSEAATMDILNRASPFDRPTPDGDIPAIRMWRFLKTRPVDFDELPL